MKEKNKRILLGILERLPADKIIWDKSNFKGVSFQEEDNPLAFYRDFRIRIIVESNPQKEGRASDKTCG